jgi:putative flippase GtrA
MNLNETYLVSIYSRFQNLILYGIIGIFSASMDFLVFYTTNTILGIFYLTANTISVLIGITVSFTLNRKYNFKVTDNGFKRFLIFLSVGLAGLLISSILLYLFIDILFLNTLISKVLSIIFVVLTQFVLNKSITFKKDLL